LAFFPFFWGWGFTSSTGVSSVRLKVSCTFIEEEEEAEGGGEKEVRDTIALGVLDAYYYYYYYYYYCYNHLLPPPPPPPLLLPLLLLLLLPPLTCFWKASLNLSKMDLVISFLSSTTSCFPN